ncbi:hypothetical protein D3248_11600 [Leucobacter zeae]|nr:hypothetical protein [Leucobacter zeae]
MDLKFSFGGASPDHHDHGGAPSGIPLPFSTAPATRSSVLEVVVRRSGDAPGAVVAEAISGDGVTYARAEVAAPETRDPQALARSVRSALSRAVAELEGPLAESVTAIALDLDDSSADVLAALGIDPAAPAVDDALQRRIGVSAGTAIRLAA